MVRNTHSPKPAGTLNLMSGDKVHDPGLEGGGGSGGGNQPQAITGCHSGMQGEILKQIEVTVQPIRGGAIMTFTPLSARQLDVVSKAVLEFFQGLPDELCMGT